MLLVSTGDNVLRLILILIIFVLVLVLTYYSSKWIAGYQKTQMINKNLEVIEGLRLAGNKYVCLVRVGKSKYMLIGIGKDEVCLLGELSAEELKDFSEPAIPHEGGRKGQSFEDILLAFRKHMKK